MIETLLLSLLAALAGTAFFYALIASRNSGRKRAARRAAFLDDVQVLFSGGLKALTSDGFPRISGTYGGVVFDVQAVPDTLNIRKLPALWLLVTMPTPLPLRATFDLMMRPRGVEIFSNHAQLPVQMEPDPAFPHDCSIRTDNPPGLPPRDLLMKHTALIESERLKELIISPKGLRIVWLAEEASRGRYLIFRDSEMGLSPFPAGEARDLLNYLLAIRDDILVRDLEHPACTTPTSPPSVRQARS